MMKTYSSGQIADYFRARASAEEGDLLSNLKLQKLCYYAAGLAAVVRGEGAAPLFQERIEAWQHGPVVPAEYHRFKEFGSNALPSLEDFDYTQIEQCDQKLLDDVFSFYGQYTAWKLRNMTHEERPWIDAYAAGSGSEIMTEALRAFFATDVGSDYIATYRDAR